MRKLCRRILTNLVPYHLKTAAHVLNSEERYEKQRLKVRNKQNVEATHIE